MLIAGAAVLALGLQPHAAAAAPRTWINVNPGAGGAFTAIGAGPTGTIVAGTDLGGACRSRDRGASWDVIGSFRGLESTHVSSVGFDPHDAQIIYLGAEGGLYRSADGGETFQAALDSCFVSAIAVSAADPSIVYAGCEESFDASGARLYRSGDRGRTWQHTGARMPPGLRILKLIADPVDTNRVYVLSGPDLFVPKAARALFRSTDGGAKLFRLGGSLGPIADVGVDPRHPSTLYVTVLQPGQGPGSGFVYKSVDGGASWSRKAAHAGVILVGADFVRVIDVAREPRDRESGVWESRDGGESWDRKSSPTSWETGWQDQTWALSPSPYGLAKTVGVDLSDPEAIYWVGSQFVHGSFDGGHRFVNLYTREVRPGWWRGRGIDNVAVIALTIAEADPRCVFAGSFDLGLWRSQDGGQSWQSCNELAWTGAWKGHGGNSACVVTDPRRAGVVWAAMGERADRATLVRSEAGGAHGTWVSSGDGLPRGFIYGLSLDRTSPAGRRKLFVTANGSVYRSLDGGVTWSRVLGNGPCRTTAVDPLDGRVVYTGGEGGMWRSTSAGNPGTWIRIGPPELRGGNAEPPSRLQWEGVHQIAPDPTQAGRVYVTAYGSERGLYRSDDRGRTWTRLKAGDYTRAVAVDPHHPEVLYLTSSSASNAGGPAAGSEGILRSEDGGQNWSSLADGLAWPFGGPVALDPAHPGRVFLGSPGSGFQLRSIDGGETGGPTRPAVRTTGR